MELDSYKFTVWIDECEGIGYIRRQSYQSKLANSLRAAKGLPAEKFANCVKIWHLYHSQLYWGA